MWWTVPDPHPHTHFLSSIRMYHSQPCLGTTEVLQMTNTVKSSQTDTESAHKMVLWLLQANKLRFASGKSSDPLSILPTHQARTESVSTPFSMLIKLTPINANLESTWKWTFPFRDDINLVGAQHSRTVPGDALSELHTILMCHPWAPWTSSNEHSKHSVHFNLYYLGVCQRTQGNVCHAVCMSK